MGKTVPLLLVSGSAGMILLVAIIAILAYFVLKKPKTSPSAANASGLDALSQLTAQLKTQCPTEGSNAYSSVSVACPGATGPITDDPTKLYETVKCYAVQCGANNACPDSTMRCTTPYPIYYPKWYYIDQCSDYVPTITNDQIKGLNKAYTDCQKQPPLWLDILTMGVEFAAGAMLGPMEGVLGGKLAADAATGASLAVTNGILQMATQFAVQNGIARVDQAAQNATPGPDHGTGLGWNGTVYGSGDWWSLQHLIDNPDYPDPPPNWELVADPKHTYVYRVGSINGQITDQCKSGSASECTSRWTY